MASAEKCPKKPNVVKIKVNLEQYIQEAQKGNQQAFRYLLNTFWSDVYNFQLKRLINQDDAEDVTIQTFAKAFDKIATYDNSYNFKTWLITLSKNISIDIYRREQNEVLKQKNQPTEVAKYLLDETPSVEDQIIEQQQLNLLLQQIKKLNPIYQQVIHLRFFQELSYKEIANETQLSIANVKVILLRAKKVLADIISSEKTKK